MPFPNFSNPYGFNPEDYSDQDAGGLPKLLRQAMQQQALQPQRVELGSAPNSVPSQDSDGYGNPQGLLGRILALQRQQRLPSGVGGESAPSNGVSSMMTPVGYRIVPSPVPFPFPWPGQPLGPESVPQIPMPTIPEPWKTIGRFLQVFPRITTGMDGSGEENKEGCEEEIRTAERDCLDAQQGRKGKSYLGSWGGRPGQPFDFDRCVKGQLSARCGGEPWDPDDPNYQGKKRKEK